MSTVDFRNERGGDEPPDESLYEFQSRLHRLKREGCNLLVVGDAPREVFVHASESMLGDPDVRRYRVFALTDATPGSVYDRLPAASATPRPPSETTKVVNHALPPRPIADRVSPSISLPEVSVSDADLAGLETELVDAIEEFGSQTYRPAELRVAVDSLSPLLDNYEFDVVRRWVRTVGEHVYGYDAMAHYLLPEPYDGDRCQRLADEFDAVVELRATPDATDHDAEERWHIPDVDVTMPWISS